MNNRILFWFLCLLFSDVFANKKIDLLFKLGVENITQDVLDVLKNNRVGLITNQTGVTQDGVATLEVLQSHNIDVRYLFVPEHGLDGVVSAGDTVESDLDRQVPAVSLYRHGAGVSIAQEHLDTIDVFVFDIQDSGMRHYTYISTMYKILKIAAEKNKIFIVFDRPNPLGSRVEGPIVKKEFESFISIAPIPLRHGMTVAELAHYYNTQLFETPADLRIVKMQNYDKDGHAFNLLAPLSPNIQSEQSVYGYSFLGLLGEIQPFDVGVGTDRAFSSVLISKDVDVPLRVWSQLYKLFRSYEIDTKFVSHYSGKRNAPSRGFLFSFKQIQKLSSFNLFIDIVDIFTRANISLTYAPVFDKSVGTDAVRLSFQDSSFERKNLQSSIQEELNIFRSSAQKSILY